MQLTHLEHLEDLLMEHPLKVIEALRGLHLTNLPMTLKWDGAPSIVFGNHPENGKFFLGTKSVFNKDPKVNYSVEDIMRNHGDNANLAQRLMYIFVILKEEYKNHNEYRVLQADLLYTQADLMLNQQGIASFMPNTLRYSPVKVDTNDKVKAARMGLAVHTEYMRMAGSLLLQDMEARPIDKQPKFGDDVFLADITVDHYNPVNGLFEKEVSAYISQNDPQVVQKKVVDTSLWYDFQIFQNSQIKDDTIDYIACVDTVFHQFRHFLVDRYGKKMIAKKTPRGIKTEMLKLEEELNALCDKEVRSIFENFLKCREIVIRAKRAVLPRGGTYNGFYAYSGSDPVGHEGVVVKLEDGSLVKIVDRQRFSKLNFHKNQKKFTKK